MAVSRLVAMGRAELLLFGRNTMVAFTALVLPALFVWMFYGMAESGSLPLSESALGSGEFLLTGMIGFVLLLVVYQNMTSVLVGRREELVLKRLRTGELTDPEILTGTALPSVALALAQTVLAVGVGAALLDVRFPVNPVLLVVAVLLGTLLCVLLAALSSAFTRTVEMAQITTLPVFMVCMVGSGLTVPLDVLPETAAQVCRLLPLTPVVELARLGWLGTTGESAPVGFGGTIVAAWPHLLVLAAWLLLGLLAFRRWFRWEPRG
ncbi:ABC transporter permease [Allostreptomyces psammosilenae]|uniref:ABC-2 type transport system permease protein n=1 Tax=Allostreptomyces psammosilenae TaxID=1892865 RepID=A0A852ZTN4_9ACTN|nr:ABC transporter permease [Allostreptomyces psammosilenae]NYI05205.1 ABC-2 type transport system permease protein [Allostreptomyces psammosilenae]